MFIHMCKYVYQTNGRKNLKYPRPRGEGGGVIFSFFLLCFFLRKFFLGARTSCSVNEIIKIIDLVLSFFSDPTSKNRMNTTVHVLFSDLTHPEQEAVSVCFISFYFICYFARYLILDYIVNNST